MANKTHIYLNRTVKIDGVDFESGTYPVEQIDSGKHSSIINAGWGELCDAPKSKPSRTARPQLTEDDDDLNDIDDSDEQIGDEPKVEGKPKRNPPKPKAARKTK